MAPAWSGGRLDTGEAIAATFAFSGDFLRIPADQERENELLQMWYFAYGSNLNSRAVAEWCRHHGHRPPTMKQGRPGVVDNYRLCFPIFSEYWGGGIADIVYDPGKYVAGVLFDLSEAELGVLDLKVNRKLD